MVLSGQAGSEALELFHGPDGYCLAQVGCLAPHPSQRYERLEQALVGLPRPEGSSAVNRV